MPLPFAPIVGFLLGLGLAWAASGELAKDDGPLVASRPFAIAAAFSALVFTPIVGYFVAFHGDWSYLYAVRWREVPSAVDFALVLASGGTVAVGFFVATPLVRKKKLGALATTAAAIGAVGLALLALNVHRLSLNGTYAQVHGGFGTEPLAASALGRGVLFMLLVLAGAVAWCVRALSGMGEGKR